MSDKTYIKWFFMILSIFVVGIIGISFWWYSKEETIVERTIEVYFNHTATGKMRMEERKIAEQTEEEMVIAVIRELQKGPKVEGNGSVFPMDIQVIGCSLEDGKVELNVSKEYADMTPGAEIICRSAIVWSVTSLEFVDYVQIQIEGQELTKTAGEAIGWMNRDNVMINPIVSPESKRYEIVTLYFTNKAGEHFVEEHREIEVSQNQTREKAVLEQLIAGPQEKENIATIPSDIKIRELIVTEDGICYLNLGSDFIGKIANSGVSEEIAIYSIVNSLVNLKGIEKVQFLIDGEKVERTDVFLDYSKPFEYREF